MAKHLNTLLIFIVINFLSNLYSYLSENKDNCCKKMVIIP